MAHTDSENTDSNEIPATESVVTIGNFDGVHLGHRRILDVARQQAARVGAIVAVVTFDPHPLTLLAPDRAPRCLMDTKTKIAALRDAGADIVLVLPATEQMLHQSPREFIQSVSARVKPLGFVEGNNFFFGHDRAGDSNTLRQLGGELGFEVTIVDPVTIDLSDGSGQRICSSLIRRLLADGRVADAGKCLGGEYKLGGRVVRGRGVGHRLGYPTANLDCGGAFVPGDGIYAGRAAWDGYEYPASIFIGSCSTFGEDVRVVEAHLPTGPDTSRDIGDIYGVDMTLGFVKKLRNTETFDNAEKLKEAIRNDIARTLSVCE